MGAKLGNPFPHFMFRDEAASIGELDAQFVLVKNAAADLKAPVVPV